MQKKKISIAQVIVFVISFVLAYFAAQYFFSKNDSTPNAMLLETTAEMNRSMPKMMDSETRLDSTSVENSTLNYHYTLINIDKENTVLDFEDVKSEMIKKAQDNLDTNPVMKDYRENNISLQYIFKDKKNNHIFDYTVQHQVNK